MTLNPGEEDELACYGYEKNLCKTILAHLVSILLLGTPYLLAYWKPSWKIKWYYTKCPLYKADTVLLWHEESHDVYVVPVQVRPVTEDFPAQYVHKYAKQQKCRISKALSNSYFYALQEQPILRT